jgi:hypothetical protein
MSGCVLRDSQGTLRETSELLSVPGKTEDEARRRVVAQYNYKAGNVSNATLHGTDARLRSLVQPRDQIAVDDNSLCARRST